MVSSLPKEHWGIAIGIINGIFGLGQLLGISLSGIFLTLAFRFYSGDPGDNPEPRGHSRFCCFDERDLSVCPWNQFCPVADLNKESRRSLSQGLKVRVKCSDCLARLQSKIQQPLSNDCGSVVDFDPAKLT